METIKESERDGQGQDIGVLSQSFCNSTTFEEFHDYRDATEWTLHAIDDKNFLAALDQRKRAWHPAQKKAASSTRELQLPGPTQGEKITTDRSRHSGQKVCFGIDSDRNEHQRATSGEQKTLTTMETTETVKSIIKKYSGSNNERTATLNFPTIINRKPAQVYRAGQVQKESKKTKHKTLNNVNFPSLPNVTLHTIENDHINLNMKRIPVQLHAKNELCKLDSVSYSSKKLPNQRADIDRHLASRSMSVALSKRYAFLTSGTTKKSIEPTFRLPRIKILPPIGSVSIPRSSVSCKFKDSVTGSSVVTSTGRRRPF